MLKRILKRPYRDLWINTIVASGLFNNRTRTFFYRLYGIKTNTTNIRPGCKFDNPNIFIEKGTAIGDDCLFDNSAHIKIGENCNIAKQVAFICSTHKIGDATRRAGEVQYLPITIGKGVWIGTRAIILPGITVGDGCIIAAGAVVKEDCQPNGLYAGVPASRKKNL